ncbi:MAG TPA: hypothetical protein VD962_10795 [Rubricoccaceae bacterium]|nr:hypothetical protein [Rubricoccaceae bacterium]
MERPPARRFALYGGIAAVVLLLLIFVALAKSCNEANRSGEELRAPSAVGEDGPGTSPDGN